MDRRNNRPDSRRNLIAAVRSLWCKSSATGDPTSFVKAWTFATKTGVYRSDANVTTDVSLTVSFVAIHKGLLVPLIRPFVIIPSSIFISSFTTKEIAMTHNFLTMTELAQHCPGRPSAGTIWRWCRHGVKSRSGHRVYLQHVRSGGRVLSTTQWMERFLKELTAADAKHFRSTPTTPSTSVRSDAYAARRVKRARQRLRQRGIK